MRPAHSGKHSERGRRNLALAGCGAIARALYLPTITKYRPEFDRVWLVDPCDHARVSAAEGLPEDQASRLCDISDELDLVIVATPNQSHYSIAREALERGASVLIEKPFVIWPEDGRKLIASALSSKRVIAVNQTRRFSPLAAALKRQISEAAFGRLQSIEHYEGVKLSWPFESGAAFAPNAQRSGVIMDFGVHAIDFYHYLFQPRWSMISTVHDGFNGPEGLADLALKADEATVSMRLSRYQLQENTGRLRFEQADVEFDIFDQAGYTVRWHSGKMKRFRTDADARSATSVAEPLLFNFIAAAEQSAVAVCDAASSCL